MQTIIHALLHAFRMVTPNFHVPPKVFIILLNCISQLIRQYFTRQLVQVSLFANILPLQNFPTYSIGKFRTHNLRVLVVETETSCEIECDDVQQEVEVRTL